MNNQKYQVVFDDDCKEQTLLRKIFQSCFILSLVFIGASFIAWFILFH